MKTPSPFEPANVTHVEVELLRRCAQVRLDATGIQFQRVNVSAQLDHMLNEMVYSLCAGLAGHTLPDKKVEYPADWWQAFKLRWFPGWLRKKYPVRMKVVIVSAKALYPEFKSRIPGQRMVVLVNTAPPVCGFYDEQEAVA